MQEFLINYVVIISALTWALAVATKGGFIGRIFTNWNRFVDKKEAQLIGEVDDVKYYWKVKDYKKAVLQSLTLPYHGFLKWWFDGSIIGGTIVLLWAMVYLDGVDVFMVMVAWLFILVSMGEEIGSVGNYSFWWGKYKDRGFPRSYGVKKAVQYGVYSGAVLALTLGSWLPWTAGALCPVVYFIGNSARYKLTGKRSWDWSEPLWGLVIGLGAGYGLKHVLPVVAYHQCYF